MKKCGLWLSASALALNFGTVAYAQSKDTNDIETLETVVVTGQRRSENLLKLPVAADALSAEDIANKNVVKVDDLQFIAPNVTIDNFGQGINFNIRGIGKGEHNSQTMTGVITYRDGVATFPGYFTEEPYYDIKSVEVWRGPQGTMVGENATGGAVLVTTIDPEINGAFGGYAIGQVGNYNDLALTGGVNIPISDTLAARVALYSERRDSFYTLTNNGQEVPVRPVNQVAVRLNLLWEPIDNLTISLKQDTDYLDNGAYPADPYYDGFKTFPAGAYYGTGTNPHYTDIYHITSNFKQMGLDRFVRTVAKLDYRFPNGTILRAVSGYQKGNTNYYTDLDGTDYGSLVAAGAATPTVHPNNYGFFDRVNETLWSQEINIISPEDRKLKWVLGAYTQAYLDNFKYNPDPAHPNQPDPTNPDLHWAVGAPFGSAATQYSLGGTTPKQAWAAFGQATYDLPWGFQVLGGFRWSTSRSKNDAWIDQYGAVLPAVQSQRSYSFDYKAALSWAINDNHFVYGTIATGYKPGGLNVPFDTTTAVPAFGPERNTNYEVGWKGTWFDGHLRTQIDGYYNQFKNFQVSIGYPQYPSFYFEVNNPNGSKLYGLEMETQGVFGPLTFSAGLGWSHSAVGQFWVTDPRAPLQGGGLYALACDAKLGPQPPSWWYSGWGTASCVNIKGHPQTYAPSLSANLSVGYTFGLPNGDKLTPRMNYAHVGPQWATLFDNRTYGDRIGVRNLLGGQFELTHGAYVVTLYGTNLTDLHYEAAMNSNLRFAGAPRQFGVRLMRAF